MLGHSFFRRFVDLSAFLAQGTGAGEYDKCLVVAVFEHVALESEQRIEVVFEYPSPFLGERCFDVNSDRPAVRVENRTCLLRCR